MLDGRSLGKVDLRLPYFGCSQFIPMVAFRNKGKPRVPRFGCLSLSKPTHENRKSMRITESVLILESVDLLRSGVLYTLDCRRLHVNMIYMGQYDNY
jgi:hypothetical protein